MIPFALGKMIAVNPTIAVILLLVSTHGHRKALAYVIGALVGPLVVGTVLLMFADAVAPAPSGESPLSLGTALQLLIGLTCLALAYRGWRHHTVKNVDSAATPGWMRMLDGVNIVGALGLGAAMTVVGVKNLLMLTGLVVVLNDSGIGFIEREIVLTIF